MIHSYRNLEHGRASACGPSNFYQYVHNNPINFIDPSGLEGLDIHSRYYEVGHGQYGTEYYYGGNHSGDHRTMQIQGLNQDQATEMIRQAMEISRVQGELNGHDAAWNQSNRSLGPLNADAYYAANRSREQLAALQEKFRRDGFDKVNVWSQHTNVEAGGSAGWIEKPGIDGLREGYKRLSRPYGAVGPTTVTSPFEFAAGLGACILSRGAMGGLAVGLKEVGKDLVCEATGVPFVPSTRSFFHKGELLNGKVGTHRWLSTGVDREAVNALNRPGSVHEFRLPEDVFRKWEFDQLIERKRDYDFKTGVYNEEFRFSPSIADEMNKYKVINE